MTTKRYGLVVLLSVVLVAAAWAFAPSLMFDGKVISVAKDKLVLSAGTEQPEFVLTAATRITLDGKPATAAELMAGQTAKITAEREETKLRALEVAAVNPK